MKKNLRSQALLFLSSPLGDGQIKRFLVAVWSMSTTEKLKTDVTFFLRFNFAGFIYSDGRIAFFAHTKTESRENKGARS